MSQNAPATLTDDEMQQFVDGHSIMIFKIGAADIAGLWRGEWIAVSYFQESVARKGSHNIRLVWNMNDQLIPNLPYTGWQTGYPNVRLNPDLSTLKPVPWESGTPSVICDIYSPEGSALELSPRQLLRRVLAQAEQAGYAVQCGHELEFCLLKGTADELAARNFRDPEPFTRGNHAYSAFCDTASEPVVRQIREQLAVHDICIEASNSEHGPVQFDVNMRYCDAPRTDAGQSNGDAHGPPRIRFKPRVRRTHCRHERCITHAGRHESWIDDGTPTAVPAAPRARRCS